MTDLLLAEELFLLTHDDESGRQQAAIAPEAGLAGALLLELAAAGLIEAGGTKGKELHVRPGASANHPLLTEALGLIAESEKVRKADYWVGRLQQKMRPLGTKVGQSLAGRGILAEQQGKVLGLFKTTKWPEVDPEPERALRARIRAVLVGGADPDERSALLIPLLVSLEMVHGVVDKPDRKTADARATKLSEAAETGAAVTSAVSASVQATQVAIMTAVMVPVVTTTITN